MSAAPVIVALTARGMKTARAIAAALPGSSVHGLSGRTQGADAEFSDVGAHFRQLFEAGTPIIGVCAAGILVRTLADVLADKTTEPPVLAVSDDGGHVAPLLGGHHGANVMARHIAAATGAVAAVTTAGDGALGFALDDPPEGWRINDVRAAKPLAAVLLAGDAVALDNEHPGVDTAWLTERAEFADEAELRLAVSARRPRETATATLHPGVLALGVGCERNCEASELIGLVEKTFAENDLSLKSVACVVSLSLKEDEAAVHGLAAHLEVPARFFDAATLEVETPRLANPSDVVFTEVGCHGVSEGAALAAVGSPGKLLISKKKSARATCAVGETEYLLEPARIGRARGRLTLVGIGPGDAALRTPEADAAVAAADDLVGYGLYIDLLGPAAAGKKRHDFTLGEEEARVAAALDLAAEGRNVALVCSGDAGIYAMASPTYELIDREQASKPHWSRLEVVVTPGISALQTAAARAGAPLGHDFCAISLSDLLTPWAVIEKRIAAAGLGDFVIAFYNPVSKRRTEQLALARDILLKTRQAKTPVLLARNLGRPGESLRLTELGKLDPTDVDMLTVVLVGSSQTRRLDLAGGTKLYTPRGYADKERSS